MKRVLLTFFLAAMASFQSFAEISVPSLLEQSEIPSTGASAETLYSIHESVLDNQGLWAETRYQSIRINDIDAARDYGRIYTRFDDHYSEATLDFARVLNSAGELKIVDEDAIKTGNANSGQDFYNDLKEIAFSLPQIEPGSIIEFQVTRTLKKRAITTLTTDHSAPYWYQPMVAGDGWRADPVINYRYSRTVPKGMKFTTKVYGDFNAKPKVTTSGDSETATWVWRDIPGRVIENAMPSAYKINSMIVSATDTSWAKVDQWFWEKVEDKFELTPALKAITDEIQKNHTSKSDQIKAVYAYVQNNIRYVYAHIGRGGYDPHFPDEVLESRYGDCKDQTVLTVALLRGLGIDAYPLLIETPRGGRSDLAMPGLVFDHVIVHVPAGADYPGMHLDTTGDRSLFPGVSAYLDDQPALLVNGQGNEAIAFQTGQENGATVSMSFSAISEGEVTVDVDIHYQGFYEQNVRSWWKHANQRETALRQTFTSLFEDRGQYQLSYRVENEDSFDQPISIHGKFIFEDFFIENEPFNYSTSVTQLTRVVGLMAGMQIPESRENRYVSRLPLTVALDIQFDTPEPYTQALVNSSDDIENPFFSVQNTVTETGGQYSVLMAYHQGKLDLSPREYGEFYGELMNLGNSGVFVVTNQLSEKSNEAQRLSELASEHGGDSAIYQIQLAKQKLNQGAFEEALPIAKKAVALDRNNGEAWFVLGSVHGYLGEIDASMDAFESAKALGYNP